MLNNYHFIDCVSPSLINHYISLAKFQIDLETMHNISDLSLIALSEKSRTIYQPNSYLGSPISSIYPIDPARTIRLAPALLHPFTPYTYKFILLSPDLIEELCATYSPQTNADRLIAQQNHLLKDLPVHLNNFRSQKVNTLVDLGKYCLSN